LIGRYVESGLQLLYGVGKVVEELNLYDNLSDMKEIDEEIKNMYDFPELGHLNQPSPNLKLEHIQRMEDS
jgi:hypothetical protein